MPNSPKVSSATSALFIAAIASLCLNNFASACVSVWPAKFTGTKGLVGETIREGKVVHLLGYQNSVQDLSHGAKHKNTGNAMLLPIPAKPGTMTRFNVINSSTCPHALKDIAEAVAIRTLRAGGPGGVSSPAIQVFDTDIYTVVVARNAADIPAALAIVPADKRPEINAAIFKAYEKWYPGWTFALCCFNTKKQTSARPLLWWYEPINAETLFFPAVDAHDGKPPDLAAKVDVDHVLAVSSHLMDKKSTNIGAVQYSDKAIDKKVRQLLPVYVVGGVHLDALPQGDFVFKTKDVRAAVYRPTRDLPPGAAVPPGCARSNSLDIWKSEAAKRQFGETSIEYGNAIIEDANALRNKYEYSEAEPLFERVFASFKNGDDKQYQIAVDVIFYLHHTYLSQHKYKQAELFAKEAIAAANKHVDSDGNPLCGPLNNLAMAYYAQGKYADAAKTYEEFLNKNLDANNRNYEKQKLAALYFAQGDMVRANQVYDECLRSEEASLNSLAARFKAEGKEKLAQERLDWARQIHERKLSDDRYAQFRTLKGYSAYQLYQWNSDVGVSRPIPNLDAEH